MTNSIADSAREDHRPAAHPGATGMVSRGFRFLRREPLCHFLLLGLVLFAASRLIEQHRNTTAQQIVIDAAVEQRLAKLYALQMGSPPSPAQLDALIDHYVHEEVLYREALRAGLDQEDEIIRRRLVQKLEFLNSDLAMVPEPSEQTLRAYHRANASQFTRESTVTFTHIYFDPDSAGSDAARQRAEAALAELTGSERTRGQPPGDIFPLQSAYVDIDTRSAVQLFGRTPIVDALFSQPVGEWTGPFLSGYGWHLVRVTRRADQALEPFEAVRERVRQTYLQQARQTENRKRFEELRARYAIIRAEDPVLAGATAVAARTRGGE